jgi:FkbM family methyltransferase
VIKHAVKSLIRSVVPCLPWSVRQRLLDALCAKPEGEVEIISRMAPAIGITEFGATGEYGLIRGPASDKIVVPGYARSGTWSAGINATLVAFFAGRPGTYFDVGANIGLTTIPVAQNPHVKCMAFEPEPVNFAHLSDNVFRNARHGNVQLHQVALLDRRATVPLGIAEGNIGDHRIGFDAGGRRRTIDVSGVPLDDFYDCIDGALAVKMDVQGAEAFAIAGGPRTLARAELVIMEFWPHGMRELGSETESVIDFIGGFSAVALLHDAGDTSPVFLSPAAACAELRQFVRDVHGRECLDVVGRRESRD